MCLPMGWLHHGPLTRYAKLRLAHAPRIPGTFSPSLTSKETARLRSRMHHGTCVTHVLWCVSVSQTRGVWENIPGIPGACATCNFAYLVRGPSNKSLSSPIVMYHSLSLVLWLNFQNAWSIYLIFQEFWGTFQIWWYQTKKYLFCQNVYHT